MTKEEMTAQHEAAHVAAALYNGIGVLGASAEINGSMADGVELAPAGSGLSQVYYSWCVFYLFPFYWETRTLGVPEDEARYVSCSADLQHFELFLQKLAPSDDGTVRRDIVDECVKMLAEPLVIAMVTRTASALLEQTRLDQSQIYALWKSVGDEILQERPVKA